MATSYFNEIPPDLPDTIKDRISERFWRRVEKTDGCWVWTGCKDRKGYGRFTLEQRWTGAHRFSWVMHNGPISNNLFVCHRCDNPPCVNPGHLFLGTNTDNVADMDTKGRRVCNPLHGAAHPMAKITDAQVIAIRQITGRSQQSIADQYGVTQVLISKIRRRDIWKHIA